MTTTMFDTLHQQHHTLTEDALARAVLSATIEPGDTDAGTLVTNHTARGALDLIAGDAETVTGIDLAALRDRALPRLKAGVWRS